MGRASKWFRGLLGFKKPERNGEPVPKPPSKKKWSFPKGKHRRKSQHGVAPGGDDDETSRQAIAVAAATAAVAEAAVAAAHAAAAVAHLTSGGGFDRQTGHAGSIEPGYGSREERAAVVIQSHFRAYLSRRALRALRALVKLQALVRGHILRKQNVDKLRQLQALVRAQARARAGRAPSLSDVPHLNTKTSGFNHAVRIPQEKADHAMLARSTKHEQPMTSKRNGSRSGSNLVYDPEKSPLIHHWMERRKGETPWEQGSFITRIVRVDDSQSDRVLEVDAGRPNITPLSRNILHSSQPSHASDQYCPTYALSKETASASASASALASHQTTWLSPSSGGVQSLSPLTLAIDANGSPFYTANNSPAYYSASSVDGSSKRAPFTPTKSCLSGYSDHPSYMAYTESSKAKARSVSAPKQRPQWERTTSQWERSNSVNRYCVQRDGEARTRLNASFSTQGYPGSGRLDKLGMPVRDVSGFSGGLWHRY